MKFIAHTRKNGDEQLLTTHLSEVGEITRQLSSKLGVEYAGELIGLLHDFGKFSADFQIYLGSATGKINPDEDDYVEFKKLKGKIDHSSAGAQWIWKKLHSQGKQGELVGQILSLCIASHHSGLIDCLKPEGENGFSKRINKPDEKTHKQECLQNAPQDYLAKLESLSDQTLIEDVLKQIKIIFESEKGKPPEIISFFVLGFGLVCYLAV